MGKRDSLLIVSEIKEVTWLVRVSGSHYPSVASSRPASTKNYLLPEAQNTRQRNGSF